MRSRAPLLLLLLVVLGVVGMHTLGHPNGHTGAGHAAVVAADEPMTAGLRATDPHGSDRTMDPLTVCVAFLATVLVLLVAALAVERRDRSLARGVAVAAAAIAGRGPPIRLGLRIADLSVSRT